MSTISFITGPNTSTILARRGPNKLPIPTIRISPITDNNSVNAGINSPFTLVNAVANP